MSNRAQRRASASKNRRSLPNTMPAKAMVERAQREGYVLFTTSPEHQQKLNDITVRVLTSLGDDINGWDGFGVLLSLVSLVAIYGERNHIDSLQVMHRDTFLKNCAERYDYFVRQREERPEGTPVQ